MANRTVKTTLVAEVNGYLSGFEAAQRKTRELGSEVDKLGQKREAFEGLGRASIAMGAVAATAVALAVARFAEFDAAMSSVQAATHAGAAEMGQLRAAAIEAGASTVFTATQAAGAIEELSKAGVATADILNGGLDGALSLASAGQLEVADAAQIAATAMTQFREKGSDVPHIADLLAAGAGKAQGSVKDLSQALNQGGLVASQAGFSIEETTGTLAAFASAGLLGSDAGTSLKTAILALQNPSKQSAAVMNEYGLNVYDTSGKMLSFGAIAAQLQDKLGGLTDEQRNAALAQIFGNDAVRAANVLYAQGADGIADWTSKVNDQGYAAETARLMLDNLKGDVEKLGGAFDTALIKSGSSANGVLRQLTQTATALVDGVGSLPEPVLAAGVGTTAFAAGLALVGGSALVAVPKVAAFKAQVETMGITMKTAAARVIGANVALAALSLAVGLAVQNYTTISTATDDFADTLDKSTGATTKYTRAMIEKKLADDNAFAGAKAAGISQDELTDAVLKGGDALDAVKQKLDANNNVGTFLTGGAIDASNARLAVTNLGTAVDKAKEGFQDQKVSADLAGGSVASAAAAYQEEAQRVDDLNQQIQQLVQQIDDANSSNQDAITSNAAYQEALEGLSGQVQQQRENTEGYTTSLDQNTAVGSGNASMLADVAAKAQSAAEKQYQLDVTTMSAKEAADKYAGTLATQRQKFEDAAVAAGFSRDQVQQLADRVFALPSAKQIDILANTQKAQVDLDSFVQRNDGRVITIRQQLITEAVQAGAAPGAAKAAYNAHGSVMEFYANGGTSENHVAQIAPASTVRVWAEPETGGEAYIPLAPSKRARSLAIWEETGRRLQAFADGGTYHQPTYVPTPPQVIYAQSPAAVAGSAAAVGPGLTVNLTSTGKVKADLDDAWFLYKSKIRGSR